MFLINGTYKCLEPNDVIAALKKEGLPTYLVEKANSWTVHHGPEPNTGYFLLTYESYLALLSESNVESSADTSEFDVYEGFPVVSLTITDPTGISIVYEKLTVTNAVNVLGKADTTKCIMLIKLEDYRWWMKRTPCENLVYNWIGSYDISISSSTPSDYFQDGTLNGASPWTVEEILTDILGEFVTKTADASFNAATYSSLETFDDILHDVELKGCSILDGITRICEAYKIGFTIKKNGNALFFSTNGDWSSQSTAINSTLNSAPSTLPSVIKVHCKNQPYELFDDGANSPRPNSVYVYEYLVPFAATPNEEFVTCPLLKYSELAGNQTEVDDVADVVASHYNSILKGYPRNALWNRAIDLETSIGFGLDEFVYFNFGAGILTTASGYDSDNHKLNYRNPWFIDYLPKSAGGDGGEIVHFYSPSGGIAARTTLTMGSASCDIYTCSSGGVLSDSGTNETVYNMASSAFAGSTHGIAARNAAGLLVAIVEDCGA
jgi:hypothetical protein